MCVMVVHEVKKDKWVLSRLARDVDSKVYKETEKFNLIVT
jgi:hypothetical protein